MIWRKKKLLFEVWRNAEQRPRKISERKKEAKKWYKQTTERWMMKHLFVLTMKMLSAVGGPPANSYFAFISSVTRTNAVITKDHRRQQQRTERPPLSLPFINYENVKAIAATKSKFSSSFLFFSPQFCIWFICKWIDLALPRPQFHKWNGKCNRFFFSFLLRCNGIKAFLGGICY